MQRITHQELILALVILGWSGRDLMRRVGASEVTVSRWRTGKGPIPGGVAAYLRLAVVVAGALRV